MCQPASFVVTKKEVFWSKNSESHTDIIEEFKLKEQDVRGNYTFVRVEIVPPDKDYTLPFKKWHYQLDQDLKPVWYDAKEVEKRCRAKLKGWRKAKVVMPNESRKEIANDHIVAIYGNVELLSGSSKVDYMNGSSKVGSMHGSSKVDSMYGSSKVGSMYGSSKVGYMTDSSKVDAAMARSIICSYNNLDPKTLKSSQAVLIDYTKDPVVCYVGKK